MYDKDGRTPIKKRNCSCRLGATINVDISDACYKIKETHSVEEQQHSNKRKRTESTTNNSLSFTEVLLNKNSKTVYKDMVGFISHEGTKANGHNYVMVKVNETNYVEINDTIVRKQTYSGEELNSSKANGRTKNCYVLFYC